MIGAGSVTRCAASHCLVCCTSKDLPEALKDAISVPEAL